GTGASFTTPYLSLLGPSGARGARRSRGEYPYGRERDLAAPSGVVSHVDGAGVPAGLLQEERIPPEDLPLVQGGVLDAGREARALRRPALRRVLVHRQPRDEAPLQPPRDARGVPLLHGAARPQARGPLSRGRALARRHLPHHREHRGLPAPRDQRRGGAAREPP